MSYKKTIDYLFSQLPMYQRVGASAYKTDLSNTIELMREIGNPENRFKSIHVAGTNGKGSTSHMLASIFQEAGYKTGLYTSPHLIDFRERIRINGKVIPKNKVVEFVKATKTKLQSIKPSFFELTVGMAFDYFAKEKVDIAIIEVGLGGRLDSTNIINPELSIITNIGLDHTQFLGNTLESISKEKAGIIKNNVPLVLGLVKPEIENVFIETADNKNSPIYFSKDFPANKIDIDLKGNYQKENANTALLAISVLIKQGWDISKQEIVSGFKNISQNTGLRGRWEVIQQKPLVICDTGHNEDGIKRISKQLANTPHNNLHMIIGMVNDKMPETILKLLPKNAEFYFCESSIPRKLPLNQLLPAARNAGLNKHTSYLTVEEAYTTTLNKAKDDDLVFIGGSTFVVADLLLYLSKDQ